MTYHPIDRYIDRTKTQPDSTTPEGRALWALFMTIMDEPDDEGVSLLSGADICAILFEKLGEFGLVIP